MVGDLSEHVHHAPRVGVELYHIILSGHAFREFCLTLSPDKNYVQCCLFELLQLGRNFLKYLY